MIKKNKQSGFTLIETLIAILILSLSVGALLSLAAGGFFTVRYARNQIVADNLVQEAVEYIRNTRDTSLIRGQTWEDWLTRLNVDEYGVPIAYDADDPHGCFTSDGCIVDPYTSDAKIRGCANDCPNMAFYPVDDPYPLESFYGYAESAYFTQQIEGYETTYLRKITARPSPFSPDQIVFTAEISWLNGANTKRVTQEFVISNWRP